MIRNNPKSTEKYNTPFPTTLRKLMEERGETQDALASVTSKTRQTVSQYVNGISEPSYITLVKIADYFNVSTDYLLGRTNEPAINPCAVDELGLSPSVIEGIRNSKKWGDEEIADNDGQEDCCTSHNALNLFLESSLNSTLYAMIALLFRRIHNLATVEIPDELQPYSECLNAYGLDWGDFSIGKKLSYQLAKEHPELTGLLRVSFGKMSLKCDLDDICECFRKCAEDITNFQKIRSWQDEQYNRAEQL